jgi:Ribonuclease G/E
MKGTLAVLGEVDGVGAAAFLRDGQLDDLLIDAPDDRIRPGAIFRARATRPMKGQGGLILSSPQGPLFFRQAKGIASGQRLIVQAATYAEGGKATPVTDRIVFKSRFCLVTPGAPGLNISRDIKDEERRVELRTLCDTEMGDDGLGIVLRSVCAEADDDAVLDDLLEMLALARQVMSEPVDGDEELLLDGPDAQTLAWRDWPVADQADADDGAFERHGLHEAIAASRRANVPLGGSAHMYVEPTRAFVAVDVNTGGDTSPAAGLKANIAAIRALPRALRLRGLGGQIVVDAAPMPKKDRRQIEQVARLAFKADAIETSIVGWTPLGHLELQRKRERLPLSESLR